MLEFLNRAFLYLMIWHQFLNPLFVGTICVSRCLYRFDGFFGGSLKCGEITELVGQSACGKTQVRTQFFNIPGKVVIIVDVVHLNTVYLSFPEYS